MQNVSRGDEHLPRPYQRALRRYHLNDSGLTGTPFNLYTSRRFKSLINFLRPDRERSTFENWKKSETTKPQRVTPPRETPDATERLIATDLQIHSSRDRIHKV